MTKQEAISLSIGQILYHTKARNRDGTALRARVSGRCKTWKTRPDEFQLPVKHGLFDSFYIIEVNAAEWSLQDPTA